jgi:hypothetical protein
MLAIGEEKKTTFIDRLSISSGTDRIKFRQQHDDSGDRIMRKDRKRLFPPLPVFVCQRRLKDDQRVLSIDQRRLSADCLTWSFSAFIRLAVFVLE